MATLHIDDNNFKKEVMQSEIPVIIDFWAPWCGPCQMMGPVFEKLSNHFSGKLKFGKVNTDENSEIANQFSVQGIPTIIIINKSKEVDRVVGFNSENSLKQKIEQILQKIK